RHAAHRARPADTAAAAMGRRARAAARARPVRRGGAGPRRRPVVRLLPARHARGLARGVSSAGLKEETAMSTYVFDHSWQRERDRLRAIESLFDPASIRYLEELGVSGGWHCLEVGCGAGGLALWLADRVGPSGRVVAIDLDTRFVESRG